MPANRFFIDSELKKGSSVSIEGTEHHHLVHVMRLGKGEEVELVNGRGFLGLGTIAELNKKSASIQILSTKFQEDSTPRICLATPFMRSSKLEWIIEKGTELGVHAFLFYGAKYSEKEDFSPRQLERLHLLSIAALKQSGRLYLPAIEILPDLKNIFVQEALFLFGDPRSESPITSMIAGIKPSTIIFISGPERGFSDEELSLLNAQSKGVRLSAHILRAETAPIAAASILGMVFI